MQGSIFLLLFLDSNFRLNCRVYFQIHLFDVATSCHIFSLHLGPSSRAALFQAPPGPGPCLSFSIVCHHLKPHTAPATRLPSGSPCVARPLGLCTSWSLFLECFSSCFCVAGFLTLGSYFQCHLLRGALHGYSI